MQPLNKENGLEVIWRGKADSVVIGLQDEHWDAVLLVR
jgi:hypothetical protein